MDQNIRNCNIWVDNLQYLGENIKIFNIWVRTLYLVINGAKHYNW